MKESKSAWSSPSFALRYTGLGRQFLEVVHISEPSGANQIRPAGEQLWYKISIFSHMY